MTTQFTSEQHQTLYACQANGYDISALTPEIDAFKMRLAYLAFKNGADITPYLTNFDYDQLDEIRLGLLSNVDVTAYAIPEISAEDMHMKRLYLEDQHRLSM